MSPMTSLPLSNGESAEYGTVLVSMPHTISFRIPELPKVQALAGRVGWWCAELVGKTYGPSPRRLSAGSSKIRADF
jgi:hypothetical protein